MFTNKQMFERLVERIEYELKTELRRTHPRLQIQRAYRCLLDYARELMEIDCERRPTDPR